MLKLSYQYQAEMYSQKCLNEYNQTLFQMWESIANPGWESDRWVYHKDKDSPIVYEKQGTGNMMPTPRVKYVDTSLRLVLDIKDIPQEHVDFPKPQEIADFMANCQKTKMTHLAGSLHLCEKTYKKVTPDRGKSMNKLLMIVNRDSVKDVVVAGAFKSMHVQNTDRVNAKGQPVKIRKSMVGMTVASDKQTCQYPFMIVINSKDTKNIHCLGMKQFIENQQRLIQIKDKRDPSKLHYVYSRGMTRWIWDNRLQSAHARMYMTIARDSGDKSFENVKAWELVGSVGSTLAVYKLHLEDDDSFNIVIGRMLVTPGDEYSTQQQPVDFSPGSKHFEETFPAMQPRTQSKSMQRSSMIGTDDGLNYRNTGNAFDDGDDNNSVYFTGAHQYEDCDEHDDYNEEQFTGQPMMYEQSAEWSDSDDEEHMFYGDDYYDEEDEDHIHVTSAQSGFHTEHIESDDDDDHSMQTDAAKSAQKTTQAHHQRINATTATTIPASWYRPVMRGGD